MSEQKFEDTATLANTRVTSDGYLVGEVRCARTGCQNYTARDIGIGDGDDTVVVHRPEEAVFARDSLATYTGKPVTRGHPPALVDSKNWRQYAVGDVGEDIARDGEFVRVSIKLMDQEAIDAVQRGEREISMGYTTPIEARDGTAPDGTKYQAVQTGPIKINHLAIVPRARGGSGLRIGDGAEKWGTAPRPLDAVAKGDKMSDQLRNIVVDGLTVSTTDQGAQAIEKLQKQLSDAEKNMEKEKETKDGQIAALTKSVETKDGELAAVKKQLSDATSPQAMADAVRARSEVLDAGKHAGIENMDTLSDADIRRAIVKKQLGDVATNMSDDAISGAYTYAAKTLGDGQHLASGTTPPTSAVSDADKAYNESTAHMRDAWKSPVKEAS
jgi:hypothetical protein